MSRAGQICLVTLVLFGASARASVDCESLLSPERIELLRKFNTRGSSVGVSVLTGNVDGLQRLVVVLGEKRGHPLMDVVNMHELGSFDAYGLEKADYSKTWGGRVFALSLRIIEAVFPIGQFGRANDVRAIPVQSGRPVRFIALERNYRPSLIENIGSVVIPALVAWQIFTFGTTIDQIAPAAANGGPLNAISTAFFFFGGLAVTQPLQEAFARYDITPRLVTRALHLIFGHSRTLNMSRNTVDSFNDYLGQATLLLIVSNHHRIALEEHLTKVEGFDLADLTPADL